MNAPVRIETTWTAYCRKRNAVQDVRDRYWRLYQKLTARMEREISEIEREFRNAR